MLLGLLVCDCGDNPICSGWTPDPCWPRARQSCENGCDLRLRRAAVPKDGVNSDAGAGLAWRCTRLKGLKHSSRVSGTCVSTRSGCDLPAETELCRGTVGESAGVHEHVSGSRDLYDLVMEAAPRQTGHEVRRSSQISHEYAGALAPSTKGAPVVAVSHHIAAITSTHVTLGRIGDLVVPTDH